MQAKKVISIKNIPVSPPIQLTAIVYLMLDKFQVPGWAWGVAWTIIGVIWLAVILDIATRKDIDIFENKEN